MSNRSKLWAVFLLLATFAAGAVMGGAATAAWGTGERRSRGSDDRRARFTALLTEELSLTTDQRDSVSAIFERHHTALRLVWDEVRPRFEAIRGDLRADVARLLDERQRAEYRRLNGLRDSTRSNRSKGNRRAR